MAQQQIILGAVCLSILVAEPVAARDNVLDGACKAVHGHFGPEELTHLPVPECRIEDGCVQVDWNIAGEQQLERTIAMFRITEEDPLRIHTTNVNRFLYTVNWTTEVETQSRAFESVSALFDSVYPVVSLAGAAIELLDDGDPFYEWIRQLEYVNRCVGETLTSYSGVVIDQDGNGNRLQLHQVEQTLTHAMPELAALRESAFSHALSQRRQSALRVNPIERYWTIAQWHADLEQRMVEFLPKARTSVIGVSTVLEPHKRNSVVRLTGQAASLSGEAVGETVSSRYFVATTRPLVYHLGYSYGRPKDLDFTEVRAASGLDLFAATKTTESAKAAGTTWAPGSEVVAFMSWEFLRRGPNDRFGVSATMGTGLEAPGQSVYYGGSVRVFSRVLLTFGAVTATSVRGEGEVADATSDLSNRSLFSAIRETASTEGFMAVSFRVY